MNDANDGARLDAPTGDPRTKLNRIAVEGFKSFAKSEIEFGDITVLLGANGSGKSNLVSFFRMLGFVSTNNLQLYVGREGGPESLLHFGARTTPQMRATVEFHGFSGSGSHEKTTAYQVRLMDAAPDTMRFAEEQAKYHRTGYPQAQSVPLGSGHAESRLQEQADTGHSTCQVLLSLLRYCREYQFHDTSFRANIRKSAYIEDNTYLRDDAGNLPAFLYAMRSSKVECYRRIEDTIRLVFPTFGGFSLRPQATNPNGILLNWHQRDHAEYLLGPHQISDGALRFMALATLLLQPDLPNVVVLDEPELGLHPSAIVLLAALIRSASKRTQVILATQSARLVDEFEPNQIAVLEADSDSGTHCRRLDSNELSDWLKDYSLGELWEKNLFGGRP